MNGKTTLAVIVSVASLVGMCIIGVVITSVYGKEPNQALVTSISFGLGGLVGILVPVNGTPKTPTVPSSTNTVIGR